MELLTSKIRKALPPLYSQDGKGEEAIAQVKFFNPVGLGTWYASEFDGEDTFFGVAKIFERELGYFSLSELRSIKFFGGAIGIERDLNWTPRPLRECD